jgi:hypothetical protein
MQIKRDHGAGIFMGGYQIRATGYSSGCCGHIFVAPLPRPYTGLIIFDGLGSLLNGKNDSKPYNLIYHFRYNL